MNRIGPKPPRKTGGDVRFISKAAALESLKQMQHHNAIMCMQLAVMARNYGSHVTAIDVLTASEPEKLHLKRVGDELLCWWGDGEPDAPLELVIDGAPDAS